jgi:predicted Zn finger-like uncharacterized protein
MQIACPNCSTTYQIAARAIGATGRSVRCVRCQSVWFVPSPGVIPATVESGAQEAAQPAAPSAPALAARAEARPSDGAQPPKRPAVENPPAMARQPSPGVGVPAAGWPLEAAPELEAASPAAEGMHVALSDIAIPVTDAPPLAPEPGDGMSGAALDHTPEDIERVAERRRIRAAARRSKTQRRISMPLVILFLLFVCGALIGLRKDIVRHVPQMASFYSTIGLSVNLRGLVFHDVKISNETHDGVPVLVVEGVIASTVGVPVDIPRIRFALRNTAGAEVYSWTAQPSQPALEPGETLPFRSRLASPPADGQDLQVRFFTKRDAAGSAR